MTTYSATFQPLHLDQLRSHLLPGDGNEHAAYVLFNEASIAFEPWDRQAHRKFISAEVIPVADEHVIESGPTVITWATTSLMAVLKRAEARNQRVAIVHNHGAGYPFFSEQDDENEPHLVQMAINRNGPGTPLLSFILTADGVLAGRVWLSSKFHEPLRMIRVIGDRFEFHYPGGGTGYTRTAFHRQALAFGKTLNQDLSQLRVGVVGCGGTGSAVAMLLPRLGIGNVLLIDNDIVDATNLNRLHGARQADADAMRPKVEVVARAITELGLGTRVVTKEAWVGDPECRDGLRACDIVLGCTDDNDGRMFLNRLALFYIIPVLDLGLAIKVGDGDPPELKALDGRVTVLLPGSTCLSCRCVTDPVIAAEEAMRREHPAEYEKRKAEAYVFGEGNPSPVVVTFTTELACMAANELLNRINGFRGPPMKNLVRKFHLMEDFKPGAKPRPGCALCDDAGYWGKGDVDPFLDRS
ncbi:ThiF family adenylyltransferase [Bradyrhizobium sp. IC3195]|uniref:ThiF family adenylyltransferase n=1 Tax=Bradyrhizobium sp. IC3195 TaxID=2793804 RepID=UPI001CD7E177|nr:ThiF family adenylyltransferase [Bradyrhizobium sp. IC3195]MCA1471161.1 ThiF family adenylyltransferase [Bradyrhizobium sp. IC3195]